MITIRGGYESGILVIEFVVLLKEEETQDLSLPARRGDSKKAAICKPGSEFARHVTCQHLDLGLVASTIIRNKGLLFKYPHPQSMVFCYDNPNG